jgi:hypothetical protein
MHPRLRIRQLVNLANGSTLTGLGVAALAGAAVTRSADGLFTGTGYRLPVPPAPAFCLGNVIVIRGEAIDPGSGLFRHEARHATQFAWCGGVAMIPLYLAAAGVSWALTGDFGARNVFERLAGLADGGYTDKPLRPFLRPGGRAPAGGRSPAGGRAPAGAALREGSPLREGSALREGSGNPAGGRDDRRRQRGQRWLAEVWG